mgnify:CR=1 FL=1
MQEHAAGGLVDILAGGDQAHAGLVKRPADVDIVGAIAGQAVELVDDDVVNPAVLCQVGQHLLQPGAVGAAGGLAAVGELFDDEGSHGLGFAAVGFALGWQGESLFGPAALGLFAGGDADVGDGAFGGEGLAQGGGQGVSLAGAGRPARVGCLACRQVCPVRARWAVGGCRRRVGGSGCVVVVDVHGCSFLAAGRLGVGPGPPGVWRASRMVLRQSH